MFSLEKIGDWVKVRKLTRNLKADLSEVNKKSLAKVGLFAERQAVMALQRQELDWQPLSEKYLEAKKKRGESEKILIATSTYIQSITSQVGGQMLRDANGKFMGKAAQKMSGTKLPENVVFAGVLKDVKDENGEEIANIAATLEYGSEKRNIPARPLWKVVYRRTGQWLAFTNLFAEEAYKFIVKKYGIE